MFSLALKALILTTMDNHMYSFNTDIRLQDEGGSIGNTLTCALAVLFMVYWSGSTAPGGTGQEHPQ